MLLQNEIKLSPGKNRPLRRFIGNRGLNIVILNKSKNESHYLKKLRCLIEDNLRSGSIFVSLIDLSRGRAKRKVEPDTSLLRSVYRPLFSLIDFFQNWPIKITSVTCYSRVLAREVKRIEEDAIFVL